MDKRVCCNWVVGGRKKWRFQKKGRCARRRNINRWLEGGSRLTEKKKDIRRRKGKHDTETSTSDLTLPKKQKKKSAEVRERCLLEKRLSKAGGMATTLTSGQLRGEALTREGHCAKLFQRGSPVSAYRGEILNTSLKKRGMWVASWVVRPCKIARASKGKGVSPEGRLKTEKEEAAELEKKYGSRESRNGELKTFKMGQKFCKRVSKNALKKKTRGEMSMGYYESIA